jgi:hypothetical protein
MRDVKACTALFEALASIACTTSLTGHVNNRAKESKSDGHAIRRPAL